MVFAERIRVLTRSEPASITRSDAHARIVQPIRRCTQTYPRQVRMKRGFRIVIVLPILLAWGTGPSVSFARQTGWQPSPGHTQIPIWPGSPPDARPIDGPEIAGTVIDDMAIRAWLATSRGPTSTRSRSRR